MQHKLSASPPQAPNMPCTIRTKFVNLQTLKGNVLNRNEAMLKLARHLNCYHECHMSSDLLN